MVAFDNIQDVLSVFGSPTVKITLLGIGRYIDKTTLAALLTGKRFFHSLAPSPRL